MCRIIYLILVHGFDIEVKSGSSMRLNQSLKNLAYAKSQGQQYVLFMPKATKSQIYDANKNGIRVIKDEAALKKTVESN